MTSLMTMDVRRWGRVRWMVRAALAVGVAASVAANMLHAQPNPVAQAIAAWPPLALLLTVELVGRVPVRRRLLGVLRILATAVIAGIAAWVSYGHMAAVVARHGETVTAARLLPISVDGLIVVASVCLVELSAHLGHHSSPTRVSGLVDDQAPTLAGDQLVASAAGGVEAGSAASHVDDQPVGAPMFGPVQR